MLSYTQFRVMGLGHLTGIIWYVRWRNPTEDQQR